MEFIDARVPKDCTWRISGDWQVGSTTSSSKVIDRIMEPVYERSDYRLSLVGDLTDNISVKDKRHSEGDLDPKVPNLFAQMRMVKNYLKPAAKRGRIVSLGMGNHEMVSMSDVGDPTFEMAEDLGVPYGGYSALIRINKQFEAMLWHGRPSISSRLHNPIARRMAIKRRLVETNRMRWPEFGKGRVKLFAQGHVNHLEVVNPIESEEMQMSYDWDDGTIKSDYDVADGAWYAVCGSAQRLFVKGKTNYAEAKGYTPLALGCIDVHIKNHKIVDVEKIVLG